MKRTNKKSGFTLVELAIVLVIIGLIVGGVLSGQDLIKTATIRSAVSQLNGYNTAALAFQNKYNQLPGDLASATAVTVFGATAAASTTGAGDGNGLVQGVSASGTLCTTASSKICIAGETAVFFPQLLAANLIGDTLTSPNQSLANYSVAMASALPASKIAGSQIAVAAMNGLNYYVIAGISGSASTGFPATVAAGLTPLQASQVDTKLDDGAPGTGSTLSLVKTTAIPSVAATTYVSGTDCAASATAYDIGTVNGNNVLCNLGIRASF